MTRPLHTTTRLDLTLDTDTTEIRGYAFKVLGNRFGVRFYINHSKENDDGTGITLTFIGSKDPRSMLRGIIEDVHRAFGSDVKAVSHKTDEPPIVADDQWFKDLKVHGKGKRALNRIGISSKAHLMAHTREEVIAAMGKTTLIELLEIMRREKIDFKPTDDPRDWDDLDPRSVKSLPVTTRALNAFETLDIWTIDGLTKITEAQFLATPNVGRHTLNEIKEALAQLGKKFSDQPQLSFEGV